MLNSYHPRRAEPEAKRGKGTQDPLAAASPSLLAGEAESPPGLAFGKPEDRLRDREGRAGASLSKFALTPLFPTLPRKGGESRWR